jgi:ribonuclease HI
VNRYILYVDGASRGNPGEAAIGASLQTLEGREVARISERIGPATNNQAEYHALVRGLELARRKRCHMLEVRADSELVVRQMSGEYKVKDPHLKVLFARAQLLISHFALFSVHHIPREENGRADELANQALDG